MIEDAVTHSKVSGATSALQRKAPEIKRKAMVQVSRLQLLVGIFRIQHLLGFLPSRMRLNKCDEPCLVSDAALEQADEFHEWESIRWHHGRNLFSSWWRH